MVETSAYPFELALPVVFGQVLGERYLLGPVIGEGGMGVVVEGRHLALDVPVAVKLIRSDLKHDAEFVQRFVNEARAAALLRGEHIARVYDVGQLETGEPYLVMELLDGMSLETRLRTLGPLGASEAVALVLELCEALAEAHAISLVHRDIKPANVFLARRPDGRSVVKLLDFGIAKRLGDKARRSLTNPARSLGSPWYMSPEQMADPSRVDERTDIWSIGVLLFEILTNDHPFDGEGVPEVCAKVLSAPTPSLLDFRPDVDPELDAVVHRCLEKDPHERFPSVHALVESLLDLLPAPSSSGRVDAPRSARRRSRHSTLGSLAPIARKLGIRRASGARALVAVGCFAVGGALAWGASTRRFELFGAERVVTGASPLRLPWDPVLGTDPDARPLPAESRNLSIPFVVPLASEGAEPPGAATGLAELALDPQEIRRRKERYEQWLRAQGLERVERATIPADSH